MRKKRSRRLPAAFLSQLHELLGADEYDRLVRWFARDWAAGRRAGGAFEFEYLKSAYDNFEPDHFAKFLVWWQWYRNRRRPRHEVWEPPSFRALRGRMKDHMSPGAWQEVFGERPPRPTLILRVAKAMEFDAKSERARVDESVYRQLNVSEVGVLRVRGGKVATFDMGRLLPEDEGRGMIRMNSGLRRLIEAKVGDQVRVWTATERQAESHRERVRRHWEKIDRSLGIPKDRLLHLGDYIRRYKAYRPRGRP